VTAQLCLTLLERVSRAAAPIPWSGLLFFNTLVWVFVWRRAVNWLPWMGAESGISVLAGSTLLVLTFSMVIRFLQRSPSHGLGHTGDANFSG
jgi:hypothetical protein